MTGGVDYASAALALAARLTDEAFQHSVRVAETAASLASVYQVDPDRARLAGLLHDWDREIGADQLLSSAERLGLSLDPVERDRPYLLHAQTGAAALLGEFADLPEDVVYAVERHTMGAEEMTPLDMVVFVADMIEPSRHYEGADELRDAVASSSLEELFARAYRRSLLHLVETGKPIHPRTVRVWNAHVARWRP